VEERNALRTQLKTLTGEEVTKVAMFAWAHHVNTSNKTATEAMRAALTAARDAAAKESPSYRDYCSCAGTEDDAPDATHCGHCGWPKLSRDAAAPTTPDQTKESNG
jgi:hypothetical protein